MIPNRAGLAAFVLRKQAAQHLFVFLEERVRELSSSTQLSGSQWKRALFLQPSSDVAVSLPIFFRPKNGLKRA